MKKVLLGLGVIGSGLVIQDKIVNKHNDRTGDCKLSILDIVMAPVVAPLNIINFYRHC